MLSSAVMKPATSALLLLIAANVVVPTVLQAQDNANPQRADPQRAIVERADETAKAFEAERITDPTVFVKSAALGLLTNIELAKLAGTKATQPALRTYAARVLREQQAIRTELAAIAKRKHLDVPTSLVYEDEQRVGQAAEMSGAEFDTWYSDRIVIEQDKSIALFKAATTLPDEDLAAFAKQTLTALSPIETPK
jgi:predicted outer membrane protein